MSPEGSKASEYSLRETMKTEEGVLTLGLTRAVVMTEGAYVLLMKVLHEHSPHIIKYAFYDMGYRVGQELMGAVGNRAQAPEEAFRYMVESFKQAGYGDLEVTKFDPNLPEVTLSGANLFEVSVAGKAQVYRGPRCVDNYSRGMFAGFMSNLLGREVVCEEIACQFRGDEKCEFVVLPLEG